MADEKVYTPEEIDDSTLPNQYEGATYTVSQSTSGGTFSQVKIKENRPPTKKIATELIGSALNTKSKRIIAEFQFTESGAIQIGRYENGVSGDMRLSPNGITARDQSGVTTFAIDATTGNAVFKGTIQAESFVGGAVYVGDNSVILDGANRRIIVNDGDYDRVLIGSF